MNAIVQQQLLMCLAPLPGSADTTAAGFRQQAPTTLSDDSREENPNFGPAERDAININRLEGTEAKRLQALKMQKAPEAHHHGASQDPSSSLRTCQSPESESSSQVRETATLVVKTSRRLALSFVSHSLVVILHEGHNQATASSSNRRKEPGVT